VELEGRVAELESELKIAAVREEIARVMPHLSERDPELKKTTHPSRPMSSRRSMDRWRKRPKPNR
jgi:hypothetical protein